MMSEQQSHINIPQDKDRKDLSDMENPLEGIFERSHSRRIQIWLAIIALIVIIALIIIQMASGTDFINSIVT